MTVVLPVLATAAPSAVLADLRAGGTSPDPAGQITRAIEYSHGKLDPALQTSLLMLAPFTAAIPTGPILDAYQDLLRARRHRPSSRPGRPRRAPSPRPSGSASPPPTPRLAQHGPSTAGPAVLPAQPPPPATSPSGRHAAKRTTSSTQPSGLGFRELLEAPGDPDKRATGQAAIRAEYANLTTALAHGLNNRPAHRATHPIAVFLPGTDQPAAPPCAASSTTP